MAITFRPKADHFSALEISRTAPPQKSEALSGLNFSERVGNLREVAVCGNRQSRRAGDFCLLQERSGFL